METIIFDPVPEIKPINRGGLGTLSKRIRDPSGMDLFNSTWWKSFCDMTWVID